MPAATGLITQWEQQFVEKSVGVNVRVSGKAARTLAHAWQHDSRGGRQNLEGDTCHNLDCKAVLI